MIRERQRWGKVPLCKISSLKDILWTSPYGPLCNAKGRNLPTSGGRPLSVSSGRWNMTFWGRLNENVSKRHFMDLSIWSPMRHQGTWRCILTSLGRRNMKSWGRFNVTPRNVPYWHPEDVLCRCNKDVSIWCNMQLQGTYLTNVRRTSFLDVLKRFLYGSISKAKKLPSNKDFCISS